VLRPPALEDETAVEAAGRLHPQAAAGAPHGLLDVTQVLLEDVDRHAQLLPQLLEAVVVLFQKGDDPLTSCAHGPMVQPLTETVAAGRR